jgi:radical SAM superfamily enzyme YgiQ (UPF0313 family)
MVVQRVRIREILGELKRRGAFTVVGGPWASVSEDYFGELADVVFVGEAEETWPRFLEEWQKDRAAARYEQAEKTDMTRVPAPRFDLLKMRRYAFGSVQFSRGCPFQCEFCDIITIYGRRPRVKAPAQVIAELDMLRSLGWRSEVFIVDDNFIGNWKNALALAHELTDWGHRNGRPFSFYTEASVDLADRPELIAAMVDANFMYVFLGIESPSAEALKSMKKFQNLRKDSLAQVRVIQESGLWVLGGFIVGFDSDDETIFERQRAFIETAGITWAMAGLLQAPPTTPLYDRMKKEGRLIEDSEGTSNFSAPNFRTSMPLPTLLRGLSGLLFDLYTPEAYFNRGLRSLELWKTRPNQKPPDGPMSDTLRLLARSIWTQGVRSSYRGAYWKFLGRVLRNYANNPAKLWMGSMILLAAHHFLIYTREVADDLASSIESIEEPVSLAADVSAGVGVGRVRV